MPKEPRASSQNPSLAGPLAGGNTAQPDESLLRAQLQDGHRWLRFMPQLEALFRADFFHRGLRFRIALLLLAAILVAATPLYDSALLQAPAGFNAKARLLQFGAMIPALLAAALVTFVAAWRKLSGIFTMMASVVVVLALLAQRGIGAQYNFDMPLEFVGISVAATFVLARFRFWTYVPVAIAMLLATIAVEAWIVNPPADGWYRLIATSMLILISAVAAYSIEDVVRVAWLNEYLMRKLSSQDSLTGLLNRRVFTAEAERSLQQALRDRTGVAVAMLDLDEFKRYNDSYGHQAGDECLRSVSAVLKDSTRRPLDCCGRYGGEEFVALWFGVSPQEAEDIANGLCEKLRELEIEHKESRVSQVVTASVGIVTCVPAPRLPLEELIAAADRGLYQAKVEGRDRAVALAC